jgi:hypothetical protein
MSEPVDQADVYNPGHATMIHLANRDDRVTACGLTTRFVDPHGARAGNIDEQINCHHCRKIIDGGFRVSAQLRSAVRTPVRLG